MKYGVGVLLKKLILYTQRLNRLLDFHEIWCRISLKKLILYTQRLNRLPDFHEIWCRSSLKQLILYNQRLNRLPNFHEIWCRSYLKKTYFVLLFLFVLTYFCDYRLSDNRIWFMDINKILSYFPICKKNGKVFPLPARLWPRGWVEV